MVALLLPACSSDRDTNNKDVDPANNRPEPNGGQSEPDGGQSEPDGGQENSENNSGSTWRVISKEQMESCLQKSCSFEELPLIGQLSQQPSLEQVASRIVAPHDWMRSRFLKVLEAMPQEAQKDILLLFRAVAIIRIDSLNSGTSFYRNSSSSIHLDANYIWLTDDERETIHTSPDYRTGYGQALPYLRIYRLVIDNEYVYTKRTFLDSESRSFTDLILPLARLLFHELAHANDYFPSYLWPQIDSEMTYSQFVGQHIAQRVSTYLHNEMPLQSEEMKQYAAARYHNATPSQELISYNAFDIGQFFEPDSASNLYNYSTIREDVAMLFEDLMVKLHFNSDRDLAFADKPSQEEPQCDDYIVSWGVRGRMGEPQVKQRVIYVAERLLPERHFSSFVHGLPPSLPLAEGCGWCDNLDRLCSSGSAAQLEGQFEADHLERGPNQARRREGRPMPLEDLQLLWH